MGWFQEVDGMDHLMSIKDHRCGNVGLSMTMRDNCPKFQGAEERGLPMTMKDNCQKFQGAEEKGHLMTIKNNCQKFQGPRKEVFRWWRHTVATRSHGSVTRKMFYSHFLRIYYILYLTR